MERTLAEYISVDVNLSMRILKQWHKIKEKCEMKIQQDKFNSEIFGIRMGNIILSDEENSDPDFRVKCVVELGKTEGFDHLSIKIPTRNKSLLNQFLQSGFYLTDTLCEYIYKYDGRKLPALQHKTVLRAYTESDIHGMMQIARDSFAYDRYHSDPTLDNSLCDLYYEKWVYNSCHGFADKIIVSEYEKNVVGFTTGKADHSQEYGHLVLSAVSSKFRGLGIYTSMIYEGVKWIESEGFQGLIVGTQINNFAVQKAWIKLGFTVLDSEYVLHLHL